MSLFVVEPIQGILNKRDQDGKPLRSQCSTCTINTTDIGALPDDTQVLSARSIVEEWKLEDLRVELLEIKWEFFEKDRLDWQFLWFNSWPFEGWT